MTYVSGLDGDTTKPIGSEEIDADRISRELLPRFIGASLPTGAGVNLGTQDGLLGGLADEVLDQVPNQTPAFLARFLHYFPETGRGDRCARHVTEDVREALAENLLLVIGKPIKLSREILRSLELRFGPRIGAPAIIAERGRI